jgi:hypothetical protein
MVPEEGVMHGEVQTRFSKSSLMDDLQRRADKLQHRYRFDPQWGWAQVRHETDQDRVIAYGRFSMLQDLIEELS